MTKSTLILNADAQPRSLIPLSVETWQDAITGIYTGKLKAVHYYEDWYVNSPSTIMQVPSVCMLSKQVKIKHRFSLDGGPQNTFVFLRDSYTCQYCGNGFQRRQLTLDHVVPKSKGGTRCWQNLVCCCAPCNSKRGTDTNIQPKNKPVRPTYDHLVKTSRKFPLTIPHITWNYYIGHPEHLIRFVDPRKIHYSYDFIPEQQEEDFLQNC